MMMQDIKSRKKISIKSKGSFKIYFNSPDKKCFRCGKTDLFAKSPKCPSKSAECHKCHIKEGHFASVCITKVSNERDNKKKINYTREDQESKEGDNEYAFVVNHQSDENSGLVDIKVGGVLCNFNFLLTRVQRVI